MSVDGQGFIRASTLKGSCGDRAGPSADLGRAYPAAFRPNFIFGLESQ